jgi:hypothetical protein
MTDGRCNDVIKMYILEMPIIRIKHFPMELYF